MLKSYAVRYGMIALALSVLFTVLYLALETFEARIGTADMYGEDWLVLIIPLTLVVLALAVGHQRDSLLAQTQQREVLNTMLRTLNGTLDGNPDRALLEALQQLTTWSGAQAAAIFMRDHQQWKMISAQWPAAWRDRVVAQSWPPARRQIVAVPLDPAEHAEVRQLWLMPIEQDMVEDAAGWLAVAAPRPLAEADAGWLLALADQIGAALTRARQEIRLRRRVRDWEAITKINRALLAGMSLDEVLDTIVKSAQVRFGLPYVTILWIDEAAEEFYVRAQAGSLPETVGAEFRHTVTAGLAGQVLRTQEPYLVADVRQEPAYLPHLHAPIMSLLLAPLQTTDRVVGIMEFGSLSVEAFSAEDVAALTALADQAAIAAENARLLMVARHEQRRLAAVLRSTSDGIILIDASNRVQLLNPAAERLLKRPAAEVVGQALEDFLASWVLLDALADSKTAEQSLEVPWDDRAVYLAALTVAQDEQGAAIGRVLVMHDITYLKQLDQLKSQMVQMLSHDIRAPLGVATGYLDVLKEDLRPFSPLQAQLIQGLEISLLRMEHLAAELLDLERIEAGVERTWASLNMAQLAQEAVDDLHAEAQAKQQQLALSLAEDVPDINGDALRLKQAVSNLVGNAVKYTPAGGNVWVRVHCEDQSVLVDVQDTGYGIPTDAQPRLFQRFFRAKAPGTEKVPGTGLGLSLVKAIVEQHGGQVSFVSVPGQGSTFTLRLPTTPPQLFQSTATHG